MCVCQCIASMHNLCYLAIINLLGQLINEVCHLICKGNIKFWCSGRNTENNIHKKRNVECGRNLAGDLLVLMVTGVCIQLQNQLNKHLDSFCIMKQIVIEI